MPEVNKTTQAYLDSSQYLESSIQHYEAIYGEDFVSPGGYDMAKELIGQLNLPESSRVLDVGCGLGGSAFVMAREFGLIVDGIDLSKNMLAIAIQKLEKYQLADRVKFEWGDCLELDIQTSYDAIYSRDVFLHIENKPLLFKVLNRALRPNGQLLFTDYCCGPKPWHKDFADYVEDRKYALHTLPDYAGLIKQAGFDSVEYSDLTTRFVDILKLELEKIAVLNLSNIDKDELQESWQGKITRAQMGDHRWGLFTGVKV